MSVYDQSLGTDALQFGDSIVELESTFEEAITIKRWVSKSTTPGAFQTAQAASYTTFQASAVVVEMGVAANMFSAGVMSAGDLVLQMRERLNEANKNIGGTQQADRVIYRNMEYYMVQRPQPIHLADDLFYIVHLRRTNSASDTVGA